MRNMYGEPYTALPTAFRYREEVDTSPGANCKVAPKSDGSLKVATEADGSTRTMIEVEGVTFPLPLRDPRGVAPVQPATVAVEGTETTPQAWASVVPSAMPIIVTKASPLPSPAITI